jgi:hypothetical protein
MTRCLTFLLLLLLPLALLGCSSGNSDAPSDNEAHPLAWIKDHPADALAVADFGDCIVCHAANLQGSGEAVSCYSCHSYNDTPPFIIHPAGWAGDPYNNHRAYVLTNGIATCGSCHGSDLHGSAAAPSCFTASFDGRGCHADGPATHPVDGTYLEGANHGPDAKEDLTICQACHGQPGGPGSNPRFNVGINSINGTGCEGCHGRNYAHPADWAGPNDTFHYSAGNIQNACTLCHGVDLDGVDAVGISCTGCHDSTTVFTLDCTFCHGYPPEGAADVATNTGVAHGNVAGVALHDTCVVCHGAKESGAGGSFSVASNYLLFDKTTDTIGNHWNGLIDMNGSAGYNEANFGCDTAGCHVNDADHRLSDSGVPVELEDFGFGGGVPHVVNGTFLNFANHGPAAKGQTASFPNGMVDCQPCHAQAGANPRFNVGIISWQGTGCEATGCHNVFAAHPSDGVNDHWHWYDGTLTHSDVPDFTMCTLCHGANFGGVADGGVAPACADCHETADPVASPSGCVSCHSLPPDGAAHPNRQGEHNRDGHSSSINADPSQTCGRCHNGAGIGTAAHFDMSGPADVNFLHPDPSDTISAVSDGANTTCNGNCHLGIDAGHVNKTWYEEP